MSAYYAEEAKERQKESGGDRKSEEYKKSVEQNSAQPMITYISDLRQSYIFLKIFL